MPSSIFEMYGGMYVNGISLLPAYLLRTLNLLHVIDRSAFMAKTSLGGIAIDTSRTLAKSNKDCLSSLVKTFSSCWSCSAEAPLLMISRTCPISSLLLFKVREEAQLDSTLGVVTLTREIG